MHSIYRLVVVFGLSLILSLFLNGRNVQAEKSEITKKAAVEKPQTKKQEPATVVPTGSSPTAPSVTDGSSMPNSLRDEWNLSSPDTLIRSLFGTEVIADTAKFMTSLMRGFPVTSNALGDMNQDTIVNIWDLIRIRNIWLGIGMPPNSYELTEGDLTRDGIIGQADVTLFRDVFLGESGLPHTVDAGGGVVQGGELRLTIPSDAVDSQITISIVSKRPDEFAARFGINLEAAAAESIYLTTAFEIDAGGYDFKKTPELVIRPYNLPPCSLRAYNGLFVAGPDYDGDGFPDLFPATELAVSADSFGLVLSAPELPHVDSIANSSQVSVRGHIGVSELTTMPGKILNVYGTNFRQVGTWGFFDNGTDSITVPAEVDVTGSRLTILAPMLPQGEYQLRILQSINGFVSDPVTIHMLDNTLFMGNADSVISNFLDTLISIHAWVHNAINVDSALGAPEKVALLQDIDERILGLSAIKDSLWVYSPDEKIALASVITAFNQSFENFLLEKGSTSDGCPDHCTNNLIRTVVSCGVCGAGIAFPLLTTLCGHCVTELILIVTECSPCLNCDWNNGHWVEVDGPKTCPNCGRRKVCDQPPIQFFYTGPYVPGGSIFSNPARRITSRLSSVEDRVERVHVPIHRLAGAIVSPIEAQQLPLKTQVRLWNDGRFGIPCFRKGQTVTLQMYDPASGLYDPDITTFTTPSDDAWTMVLDHPIVFLPDTTRFHYFLAVDQRVRDSIGQSRPRIEYNLRIPPGQQTNNLRMHFGAQAPLTLWIQDSVGSYLVRDSIAQCEQVPISVPGVYKVTVTYGVAGGHGPFEILATANDGFPLISYLCGSIKGKLYDSLSPYFLVESIYIAENDSLTNEEGVQTNVTSVLTMSNHGYVHLSSLRLRPDAFVTHPTADSFGITLSVDTLIVDFGATIDVSHRGYRGVSSDGWTGNHSESYPGHLGSSGYNGGSHGGFGGTTGTGYDVGDVYDVVDNPFALGSGGGGEGAPNGGGLVRLTADVMEVNGSILADGGTKYRWAAGGAGGSINLQTRVLMGTGTLRANGGSGGAAYYEDSYSGGGGGRIAVKWQEGNIDNWVVSAQGGPQGRQGQPGGAGTIYFSGPGYGSAGRLIADNGGLIGPTTPLPTGRTQFKSASISRGARFTVGSLAKQLTLLDSVTVRDSLSEFVFSDNSSFTTPKLVNRYKSKVTFGKDMIVNMPLLEVDSSSTFITETSLTFANATDVKVTNGAAIDNRKTATFTVPRFESDNMVSGKFSNWGLLSVVSDSLVINSGFTLNENGRLSEDDSVSSIRVLGYLGHSFRNEALLYDDNLDAGLVIKVGKLTVEPNGYIYSIAAGYRGARRDGWTEWVGETEPGYAGSNGESSGGSHGGYGGLGRAGTAGAVYGNVGDPSAFGAGSAGWGGVPGKNGGGLIRLDVDQLVVNGGIYADGQSGWAQGGASGGGAGGSINLRVGNLSGSGTISARGGAGGGPSDAGGGGGGRIAIRWQSGDIGALSLTAMGREFYDDGNTATLPISGGAGTIYLLGPSDNPDGRLLVDNGNLVGMTTPLLTERTQFKEAIVSGGAKFSVGDFADQLTLNDSVTVRDSLSEFVFSDNSSFTTPKLVNRYKSKVTFGKDMIVNMPLLEVDSSSTFITETSLTFASATDVKVTSNGVIENRKTATFTIPRFEPDNMVSGGFVNWGVLNVLSDSLVISANSWLAEDGRLSVDDSVSQVRVMGYLTHSSRVDALQYDDNLDTGLVFNAGRLVVEPSGVLNAVGVGYRGINSGGWTGSTSETYPGFTGASSGCGGSHAGYGGVGGYGGDAGDIYGSESEPLEFGAGGARLAGLSGSNGGGLIRLEVGELVLNGTISANGQDKWRSPGGAGGSVNLRIGIASGTGAVRATGGNATGYPDVYGGGGGGRIAIRWQTGSISSWTLTVAGGTGAYGGQPGNPGSIYTEQVSKTLGGR